MDVKRKNQKLFIIVGVLLLCGGVSLAYFISNVLMNGSGASTKVTTASIKGATIKVEGVLDFHDLNILPGHKIVSGIKVTATGNNELIPYNLIWQGINTLTTPLNFTVYKTSEQISVTSTCEAKTKVENGIQQLSEECNISNLDKFGSEIATGVINKNETKVTLTKDEFITSTSDGMKVYYYVILEYPNLGEEQNYDLEGKIEGEVTVEESNIKPDINIIAAYVKQDNGEYRQVEDIPQEGYKLNTTKSTCSNGATPTGVVPNITVNNLTKRGTSCYLYFDEYVPPITVDDIIVANNPKESPTTFTGVATTDEGVYKVEDGMYGDYSYYWRGAATTNHVIFANKCWRIIRINGDNSIRLIYNGTPTSGICPGNGSNAGSIAVTSQAYNTIKNQSNYAGWTYSGTSQRTLSGLPSNAKDQTESWFNNNSNFTAAQREQVADGYFCNDRNAQSGSSWAIEPSTNFYYAAHKRTMTDRQPTLSCPDGDKYTLKVGTITADDVMFAGGWDAENKQYYLYNGQNYWTMSPSYWRSSGNVGVFYAGASGSLSDISVDNTYLGLRPVINLKSDTLFAAGGLGTQNNPYVVVN